MYGPCSQTVLRPQTEQVFSVWTAISYGAVPCTKCLQPEQIVPIGRTVYTMKEYLTEYEERAGEFGCFKGPILMKTGLSTIL